MQRDIVFEAMVFAWNAHQNQVRKYTGEPYFSHLVEVTQLLNVAFNPENKGQHEVMLAAAWLHDTVEDCGVTEAEIEAKFGALVASGVRGMTDVETEGNRAQRKAAARERLSACLGWVQTIKCADLLSNTTSIIEHDPKFAKVYVQEALALLSVLEKADPVLRAMAWWQINRRAAVPQYAKSNEKLAVMLLDMWEGGRAGAVAFQESRVHGESGEAEEVAAAKEEGAAS